MCWPPHGCFGRPKLNVCLYSPLKLQKTWHRFPGFQTLISAPCFSPLVLCHFPISKRHEVKHTTKYWTCLNVVSFSREPSSPGCLSNILISSNIFFFLLNLICSFSTYSHGNITRKRRHSNLNFLFSFLFLKIKQ